MAGASSATMRRYHRRLPTFRKPARCISWGWTKGSGLTLLDLRRTADGQSLDLQRRLTDAHRYALAVLAARADASIEREIVADHRHPGQRIRTVADQRRTLHRIGELSVLDDPCFSCRKHEFAARDV